MEREKIEFDVLFVGGGPASLASAIQLMQLAKERNMNIEAALIEKGAEIGSHSLSGAILNPLALNELMPDYKEKGCPIETTVRGDEFYFMTSDKYYRIPFTPRYMKNKGFHVISLSKFTKWLAKTAEELGVNIFPGFAGKQVLYDSDGKTVTGVRIGDKGIGKDGIPKENFEPGVDIGAKITIFGEGAAGSLMRELSKKIGIFDKTLYPQVFETGIKEVIQLPEKNYFKNSRGNDIHTFGYPIGINVPGGGFIYEMSENKASVGFITGLSYSDPMRDIYDDFIRFKQHPLISRILKGGKVIEQGARTVCTGGYYTMPMLCVNGAMIIGGAASMQNTPGLKGIHVSMKSGMLAAQAAISALEKGDFSADILKEYPRLLEHSWLKTEIYEGRNFSQAMSKKFPIKFIYLGLQYITQGKGARDPMPVTEDYKTLEPVSVNVPPFGGKGGKKPVDGELIVDKLTGIYLSKTMHREDQPSHIIIHDKTICENKCYETYLCPCTRFCPGGVYEIEIEADKRRIKLNPSNCLHCKTCEIKDPYKNITWTCPEGGEGPGYSMA